MGYFGKQVGRPIAASNATPVLPSVGPETKQPHFAAQVGRLPTQPLAQTQAQALDAAAPARCPRCMGLLDEEAGLLRCEGRCGGRWVIGSAGRLLDPATLPFGVCVCCLPRVPLVGAEVGAICPHSHMDYLLLPEGVVARAEVAPLGICRCCLPPQPLVQMASGLVCRNKPQQHYQVVNDEMVWVGLAPAVDQAAVTAAIDAALRANSAELTLFGLFAPP